MYIGKKTTQKGFSFIDVITGIAILSISVLTLYSLYNFSLKVLWENKARVTGSQIANQKMELIKNLPYSQVGLVGGIPAGPIFPNEAINRNGIDYTVNTSIIYIDDPFDGTLNGSPNDLLNTDYKRVRISISWPTRLSYKPIIFLTDISPNGLESNVGGGTISLTVFNANGEPVSQANVHIENNVVTPAVDFETTTNDQGKIILPGAPPSINNYNISVTKTNYSSDSTVETSVDNPSPTKPPLSVFENEVTSASFSIDLVSNINVQVIDQNSFNLGSIPVMIKGAKIIGTDGAGNPIYKYDQNFTTDNLGQITLTNLEWDSYTLTVPTSTSFNLGGSNPSQPLNLLPNTTQNIILTLVPQSQNSLLVVIKDAQTNPIENATVRLYNLSLGLDETLSSSSSGQSYFTPWQNATSTLQVTKDGYLDYQIEVVIDGYTTENVIMTMP